MSTMELMTLALPANRAESLSVEALRPALNFAQDKSAVAIGPGLSQNAGTKTFVREFISRCDRPMVIDADALNALAGRLSPLDHKKSPCILTPHPGEMARLCRCETAEVQKNREAMAARFAQDHGCVVVLKGHRTVIAGPEGDVFVNPTGNSGMATGGTGDVLTGILSGLLAQGVAALDAARLGVYAHGLAGDLAAAERTERALIAGDVIEKLPAAWRYIEGAFEP
jgi:NAD(P)H-hydrate epimerase